MGWDSWIFTNPVFEGSRYLLGAKKIQSVVELLDLKTMAKMISPHLDLILIQTRLLHDVLDITGSEHEVGLAGEHGALEVRDTLVWEAWWHGGCFRAWLLAALPFIGKAGFVPSPMQSRRLCVGGHVAARRLGIENFFDSCF